MIKSYLFLFWILLFTGCFSYQLPKSYKELSKLNIEKKPTVYVTNKEACKYEYKVLKKSDKYIFTTDSACTIKITLKPILKYVSRNFCMTGPVTALFFTFGQVPLRFEQSYSFSYTQTENNVSTPFSFLVKVDTRVWFWDMLSWRKSQKHAIAKSLNYSMNTYSKQ